MRIAIVLAMLLALVAAEQLFAQGLGLGIPDISVQMPPKGGGAAGCTGTVSLSTGCIQPMLGGL